MVASSDMDQQVTEVLEWLKTQPHLPQNIDKSFLKRFVYSMYGDVEGAKRLIELNLKMRNKYDHIFLKRDPLDESSQKLLEVADLIGLPGKTKDNHKLILYRLNDIMPEKFNFTDSIRVFFMMADCRFAVDDEDDGDVVGEVPIFDMTGYTLRHLARTVLTSLRIYMKFIQEAHPVRIQQIHVLNVPSYLDKVMAMVKPFIKSELFNLIRFHLPNAETPFEYFSRDMLPEEYGGKAGKLEDLRSYWLGKLKENRDYIMDESRWKINKNKKSSTNSQIIHSFQQLDID